MIGYSRAFNELYGPKPIEGKSNMNDRIRELAEQANIRFGRVTILDGDPRGMARFVSYSEFEKFAELIVGECCDWIDGSPATDAGQLLLTKSFIIANLKGHFGVAE